MSSTTTRHCPGCDTETAFEVPPCADGHDDCADRACTRCGYALAGPPGPEEPPAQLPLAA